MHSARLALVAAWLSSRIARLLGITALPLRILHHSQALQALTGQISQALYCKSLIPRVRCFAERTPSISLAVGSME